MDAIMSAVLREVERAARQTRLPKDEIEDLVNDTAASLLERQEPVMHPKAFGRAIVRHHVSHRSKVRRGRPKADVKELARVADPCPTPERIAIVNELLEEKERLGERDRQIVTLREQGVEYVVIKRQMGFSSVLAARKAHSRAILRLRRQIAARLGN